MTGWIKSKLKFKADFSSEHEYERCIHDLIQHETVYSMKNYIQHRDISCLKHSLYVSYSSYLVCKWLRLDYRSAARGGLLHDFFLYDWHIGKLYIGFHRFMHPYIALKNATQYFHLNELEKDIIQKHMWPLTIKFPRYRESFIVSFVDKYCAAREIIGFDIKRV